MASTVTHDLLVDLFCDDPELVTVLLRVLGLELPGPVVRVDASFSAPIVGYQGDAAFIVERPGGALAVVVEVQLRKDARKRTSWPIYEANARARHGDACVLVLAPDAVVARWAAEPIVLGPSGSTCRPLVVGPDELSRRDAEGARGRPGLAAMTSLAHADDPRLALDAILACAEMPEDKRELYFDVIMASLDEAARNAVEAMMDPSKWEPQSEFFKRRLDQAVREAVQGAVQEAASEARSEGLSKGLTEGLSKGLTEGLSKGRAEALLRVLSARGIALSDADRGRIEACDDAATLDAWLERAATATRLEDVFGA